MKDKEVNMKIKDEKRPLNLIHQGNQNLKRNEQILEMERILDKGKLFSQRLGSIPCSTKCGNEGIRNHELLTYTPVNQKKANLFKSKNDLKNPKKNNFIQKQVLDLYSKEPNREIKSKPNYEGTQLKKNKVTFNKATVQNKINKLKSINPKGAAIICDPMKKKIIKAENTGMKSARAGGPSKTGGKSKSTAQTPRTTPLKKNFLEHNRICSVKLIPEPENTEEGKGEAGLSNKIKTMQSPRLSEKERLFLNMAYQNKNTHTSAPHPSCESIHSTPNTTHQPPPQTHPPPHPHPHPQAQAQAPEAQIPPHSLSKPSLLTNTHSIYINPNTKISTALSSQSKQRMPSKHDNLITHSPPSGKPPSPNRKDRDRDKRLNYSKSMTNLDNVKDTRVSNPPTPGVPPTTTRETSNDTLKSAFPIQNYQYSKQDSSSQKGFSPAFNENTLKKTPSNKSNPQSAASIQNQLQKNQIFLKKVNVRQRNFYYQQFLQPHKK